MSILLVTYDFNKERTDNDREKLRKALKGHASDWARLSESSYAVETSDSPQSFYDKISSSADSNDRIIVISLKRPYAGQHSKEVVDWLEKKLTY